jgi:hormone-sensitive lipase
MLQSHEMYLKEWAREFNAPILSVDYSLAPEHPYPAAANESFYAYCWALQNAPSLGTTAEKVILVGDSAGGNLVMSVAIRVWAIGIYGPTLPSPQHRLPLEPI